MLTKWRLAGLLLRRPSAGFCPTRCISGAPSPPPTFPSKCGALRSSCRRCSARARPGRACGGGKRSREAQAGPVRGNARPLELLGAAAESFGLAGRGQSEGPGVSSGWRRGELAQRELRRSGARGPGRGRVAPAIGGGQGDGARSFQYGSDVQRSAGVLEPPLKVLSSAGVAREVEESICSLAGTWRTGRGVSLLWGLEVLKKR